MYLSVFLDAIGRLKIIPMVWPDSQSLFSSLILSYIISVIFLDTLKNTLF